MTDVRDSFPDRIGEGSRILAARLAGGELLAIKARIDSREVILNPDDVQFIFASDLHDPRPPQRVVNTPGTPLAPSGVPGIPSTRERELDDFLDELETS